MAMLEPDVAILDETDSGLDIDALRTVAEGVATLHDEQGLGALIITHYQRILHYVAPQFVHVMMDGRIVLEGGVELVERLEREGYDQIRQEVAATSARAERRTDRPSRAGGAGKPGSHREATLYHALDGAGAGDGRPSLAELRERALRGLRELELPVWRRSGFWTTSFSELELGALERSTPPERRERRARGRDAHAPDRARGAHPRRPARAERRFRRRRSSSTRSSPSGA